MTYLQLMLLNL